jgi:hypothetical protein
MSIIKFLLPEISEKNNLPPTKISTGRFYFNNNYYEKKMLLRLSTVPTLVE